MSLLILNFHGVGPTLRNMENGERECWLDQDFFESVLDLIQGHPHVRLTVDDGNISDLSVILPALLKRGLQATFFVCSGRLDQPTFLGESDVRILQKNGMRIGSHGVNHRVWPRLTAPQLHDEVVRSKNILEKVCGHPIDRAACPFGAYNRRVLKALRHSGYQFVYTSDGGATPANRWLQARTTVTRSTSPRAIEDLVRWGPGTWRQSWTNVRKLLKRLR